MYEDYFGFKEKPFEIAPDPDYLFLSRQHQNAISSLEFGLMDNAGLILLTGEIGTGKTTIIRHILGKIEDNFIVGVVFNTNVDANQFLGLVLEEFGINVQSEHKAGAIKDLNHFLVEAHSKNRRPLIIVDDAQSLSMEALEEVRLLSNLQDGNKMLLQIMLVGQPELNAKLKGPAMASLCQRIAVNYHLQVFNREETGQYIAHRLETAGGRSDLFTDAAVTMIHGLTRGTPRSINLLCHAALVYGFADEIPVIEVPVIEEIVADTQNTGIGAERWYLDQNPSPAPHGVDGAESQLLSGMESVTPQQPRNDLEGRIEELERRLGDYTKDLREALNLLLTKERSRNDKLLMAYTRLKTRYEDQLKEHANDNRHDDDKSGHID
jgi:general secretion pathway protein A